MCKVKAQYFGIVFMGALLMVPVNNDLAIAESGKEVHAEHDGEGEQGGHEGHDGEEEQDGHGDHEGHEGEGEHEEGVLTLDTDAQKMIGLASEVVGNRMLGKRIRVYGKIAKDTDKYQHITSSGDGTIREVHVVLGSIVEKGTRLLTIRKADGTFDQIVSPDHGTIIGIYVQEGETIDSLKSLISIVNLDILRASVDVYEKDLRFISIGQMIEVKTIAYPEKTFFGNVLFISPEIDDESNAIKVRVDVDNRTHLLKLGMAITGDILFEADKEVVVVPRSAIQNVRGKSVVFIVSADGDFKMREIALGQSMDSVMEVRYGIHRGERVVTGGSFYLKAEIEKGSFGDGHNH